MKINRLFNYFSLLVIALAFAKIVFHLEFWAAPVFFFAVERESESETGMTAEIMLCQNSKHSTVSGGFRTTRVMRLNSLLLSLYHIRMKWMIRRWWSDLDDPSPLFVTIDWRIRCWFSNCAGDDRQPRKILWISRSAWCLITIGRKGCQSGNPPF